MIVCHCYTSTFDNASTLCVKAVRASTDINAILPLLCRSIDILLTDSPGHHGYFNGVTRRDYFTTKLSILLCSLKKINRLVESKVINLPGLKEDARF